MIFVGIDVAKDKHDCFILNSEGTVLADVFTIANNRIGFETLLSRIQSCSQGESKIKVGLEATGHYSYNLLGFLLSLMSTRAMSAYCAAFSVSPPSEDIRLAAKLVTVSM